MRLVTFSGVDGSGKSTQLSLLREYLEREGKKVAYFHATEFSLANRLNRSLKGEKDFRPGKEKAVTKASPFSLFLREVFLLIDALRFRSYRAGLEKEGFDYLLSDRFFQDSLVNIAYLKGSAAADSWVRGFLPKADQAFYFDVPASVIMQREQPPEQGAEYVEKKSALYRRELAEWNMTAIDADRPKEAISEEIKGIIK